jgi:protein-disulfide isomerase
MLPALPARAQPTGQDWSRSVTISQGGAFLFGNPAAQTRLVEYFSYTCPHCADFAKESNATLLALVKSGRLSIEFRNYVRDGYDLAAALLARCGGAARFMATHDAIFSGYDDWMTRVQSDSRSRTNAAAQDQTAQLIDMADKTGLTALVARQGISADTARACLANKNNLATILAITAGVWDAAPAFEGTPSFLIDGKLVAGVHGWASLRPLLPVPPAAK